MRRPGGIRGVKAPHPFRGYRMDRWRGRSMAARVAILGVLASLLTALPVASSVTAPARAAATCPADGCAVTVFAAGWPGRRKFLRTPASRAAKPLGVFGCRQRDHKEPSPGCIRS